jgi:hypothetical protein
MIAKTIVIGWTLFLLYTFCAGVADIPDTRSDEGVGYAVMFSMILHFLIWCSVAIPTFVISDLVLCSDSDIRDQSDVPSRPPHFMTVGIII